MTTKLELGLIGLGTMGRNLLLNMADNNHRVMGYDKDSEKVRSLEGLSPNISTANSIEEFIGALSKPRRVMLLVPAGPIVDYVIADVLPFLEKGDIIIDGGNSYFKDTLKRQKKLLDTFGIHLLGVGISGGAEGARKGPSIMPGGKKSAYNKVRKLFENISAKVGKQPCVAYLGTQAVGHYVKTVHNGIEYGMMQLLAESYDLMKQQLNMDNREMHFIFDHWNQKELNSFLVEITAAILIQANEMGDGEVIDYILDAGKQKGTGKWTSQEAKDIGVAVPTIDMAVIARILSGTKVDRIKASKIYDAPNVRYKSPSATYLRKLKNACFVSFLITYSQGMSMLQEASEEYDFELDLEAVARIWRGGCIIRAKVLEDFRRAFKKDPKLSSLLLNERINKLVNKHQKDLRWLVQKAAAAGIAIPCFMASLSYLDSFRRDRLPMNMVQAQRDYFGAHTYQRIDKEGAFHTEWDS